MKKFYINKFILIFLFTPITSFAYHNASLTANYHNKTLKTYSNGLNLDEIKEICDPNHPENLSKELLEAYARGARKIKIKTGVYNLPEPPKGKDTFLLRNWSNAEIDLSACTLIVNQTEDNFATFKLYLCDNVTLKGGTIVQTKQPAYQGEILAIGKDEKNNITVDWKPDTGYPIPAKDAVFFGSNKGSSGLNVADRSTKKLKPGIKDIYNRRIKALDGGLYRIFIDEPIISYGVGDILLGRNNRMSFKIFLANSTNCTIRDIDLQRNGFSTIREDKGGANKIINCKWSVGEKPKGATEESLVSASADGFHSTNTFKGALIEGCNFTGILLDDPIAIHSAFVEAVFGTAGNELVVNKEGLKITLSIGDPIRSGALPEARIIAITQTEGKITYTIDKSLPITAGDKFYNPAICGPGAIIRNNTIGNTRSRGVLLKGDHILIENNIFDSSGMSAISLGPEESKYGHEAGYVKNVVIKGNTFINNGYMLNGKGIIYIHGQGAIGNTGIFIKDNIFKDNYNTPFYIEYTDGIEIANNKFKEVAKVSTLLTPSFLFINNSKNISLINNEISKRESYKTPLVNINKNVTNLIGNDENGLKTKNKILKTSSLNSLIIGQININ
jgi:hypothetical protein